jgi:hypothetical protein
MSIVRDFRRKLGNLFELLLTLYYSLGYSRLQPKPYSKTHFEQVVNEGYWLYEETLKAVRPLPPGSVHPIWERRLAELRKAIQRGWPEWFLSIPCLRETMVRRRWSKQQELELCYLNAQPDAAREIVRGFVESRVGGPHLECKQFNCSSNTLGHLYYAYRIVEFFRKQGLSPSIEKIVEFGGGYGNFARVALWKWHPSLYTIIDFPELCFVQYVFLRTSDPGLKIHFLTNSLVELPQEGICLVPVQFLMDEVVLEGQLFISHFALNEAGPQVRKMIYERRFFRARQIYYVGAGASRWTNEGVGVEKEICEVLSASPGWNVLVVPYHMEDCYEIFAYCT